MYQIGHVIHCLGVTSVYVNVDVIEGIWVRDLPKCNLSKVHHPYVRGQHSNIQ